MLSALILVCPRSKSLSVGSIIVISTYRWCYFCFLLFRLCLSADFCRCYLYPWTLVCLWTGNDYNGWTPHDIIRWLPTVKGCFGPSKPWHPSVGGSIVSIMKFLTTCRGTSTPFIIEDGTDPCAFARSDHTHAKYPFINIKWSTLAKVGRE